MVGELMHLAVWRTGMWHLCASCSHGREPWDSGRSFCDTFGLKLFHRSGQGLHILTDILSKRSCPLLFQGVWDLRFELALFKSLREFELPAW